uniref:hypothetical protein n=1 Tax=Salinibacter sp. TaxID=2065818 RepID=UPI0021E73A20
RFCRLRACPPAAPLTGLRVELLVPPWGSGRGGYEASRADGQASAKDLVANAVGIGLAGGLIVL